MPYIGNRCRSDRARRCRTVGCCWLNFVTRLDTRLDTGEGLLLLL